MSCLITKSSIPIKSLAIGSFHNKSFHENQWVGDCATNLHSSARLWLELQQGKTAETVQEIATVQPQEPNGEPNGEAQRLPTVGWKGGTSQVPNPWTNRIIWKPRYKENGYKEKNDIDDMTILCRLSCDVGRQKNGLEREKSANRSGLIKFVSGRIIFPTTWITWKTSRTYHPFDSLLQGSFGSPNHQFWEPMILRAALMAQLSLRRRSASLWRAAQKRRQTAIVHPVIVSQ